jgi:hypothetical protein
MASRRRALTGLRRFTGVAFERVRQGLRRNIYGVPYVHLEDESGGKLWVTRHGWRHLEDLDPREWFAQKKYRKHGRRLSDGSGAVYRYQSAPREKTRSSIPLVVKFSRFAQDVQFGGCAALSAGVSHECLDKLVFNDPFQEFGLLEELRRGEYGPNDVRILTKRPLAIYSPGRRFDAWQMGRSADAFRRHQRHLESDQQSQLIRMDAEDLSIERQYIMLFHWVRGTDAQSLIHQGVLSTNAAEALVRRVHNELAAKGFRVLDTKPSHIILRDRDARGLIRRNGRLTYAMVDFELLQRTDEYQRWRERRA